MRFKSKYARFENWEGETSVSSGQLESRLNAADGTVPVMPPTGATGFVGGSANILSSSSDEVSVLSDIYLRERRKIFSSPIKKFHVRMALHPPVCHPDRDF